jgi:NAD+ kinase
MSSTRPHVLCIYKKSAYEIYVREHKHPRVGALLRASDPAVAGLLRAHKAHVQTLREARALLRKLGARTTFRRRSAHGDTSAFDLVVTIGGDGTLLWASQMIDAQLPVLAVNSAPEDSIGYFCAASRGDLGEALSAALAGRIRETRLTRMSVELDGVLVTKRVLNDALFSHASPAATTRYTLCARGRAEDHKSSGVWISTAAGSTAAIASAGGRVLPIESTDLQFLVREPYARGHKPYRLLKGLVRAGTRLEIQSHIRAGRLYLDGPHVWRAVDIGSRMAFARSPEPLCLLGFRHHRARS